MAISPKPQGLPPQRNEAQTCEGLATPENIAQAKSGGYRPTRRDMLRNGALATAGVYAASHGFSQGVTPSRLNLPGARRQTDEFWLLNRASFGFTPADYAEIQNRGYDAWLDWQLDPMSIPDAACDAKLSGFHWLTDTAHVMLNHPSMDPWEFGYQNQQARNIRAVLSKRQLHERLTEFWTDHFNVYGFEYPILKVVEDRDIIRALGLGKFRDLLQATAKGPAMLEFLDNATNTEAAPNENYAREVMELHTLGVTGSYTETDVQELARCFTGWNYKTRWWVQNNGGQYGDFHFRTWDHDYGAKTVLGQSIPAGGGVSDAETILDLLADHPETRAFVCGKLCRWFLGYQVPQPVIDRAELAWQQSDGLISEVVRSILSRTSLRQARPWESPKIKRPHHWLASALRGLDNDVFNSESMVWSNFLLGQPLFRYHGPDGYPDNPIKWASRLQPRWHYASIVGHGWWWGLGFQQQDFRRILQGIPKSRWMEHLNEVMCGGLLSEFELDTCQRYLDVVFSTESNQAVGEAFEFVFSAPTFQTY